MEGLFVDGSTFMSIPTSLQAKALFEQHCLTPWYVGHMFVNARHKTKLLSVMDHFGSQALEKCKVWLLDSIPD